MKVFRAVLAVAVIALASVPLVSAESASGAALCEETETLCQSSYPAATSLELNATNLAIETSTGTISCAKSTAKMKTNAAEGEPLSAEVSSFTFSSCSLNVGGSKIGCTANPASLPYTGSFEWTHEDGGTLKVTSGAGKGTPGFNVVCGIFLSCTFGGELTYAVDAAGETSSAMVEEEELTRTSGGGLCPEEAFLSVEYQVRAGAGQPAFVNKLRPTVLCTANQDPCPKGAPPGGKTWPLGTEVEAKLVTGASVALAFSYQGNQQQVQCSQSVLKSWKIEQSGALLAGVLGEMSFTGCGNPNPCTVTTTRLPYVAEWSANRPGNGNGKLEVRGPLSGHPDFHVVCGTMVCNYESALTINVTGAAVGLLTRTPPQFLALVNPLTEGANCGATATWTAAYEVTKPQPLYLERG